MSSRLLLMDNVAAHGVMEWVKSISVSTHMMLAMLMVETRSA